MVVTSVETDYDNLSLIVLADFDASVEQVWELWADPRQLERWWGPPGYPASFEKHSLARGGDVTYYMTSPEGEKYRGWWRVNTVNPPQSLTFTDGFSDADGLPVTGMPTTEVSMQLLEQQGGTRMELRSVFASRQAMDQLVEMGMVEGMQASVGQIDAILAES